MIIALCQSALKMVVCVHEFEFQIQGQALIRVKSGVYFRVLKAKA